MKDQKRRPGGVFFVNVCVWQEEKRIPTSGSALLGMTGRGCCSKHRHAFLFEGRSGHAVNSTCFLREGGFPKGGNARPLVGWGGPGGNRNPPGRLSFGDAKPRFLWRDKGNGVLKYVLFLKPDYAFGEPLPEALSLRVRGCDSPPGYRQGAPNVHFQFVVFFTKGKPGRHFQIPPGCCYFLILLISARAAPRPFRTGNGWAGSVPWDPSRRPRGR